MFVTIISFLIILSVLVLVHELGHYLVAKFFKIKVEEFGFGFPPRVFGKKIGETIYSINLLPIGGFVKLYGEDDAGGGSIKVQSSKLTSLARRESRREVQSEDESRAFYARPLWQRIAVVVAGVVMNFTLAVVLISTLFATVGVAVPTENVIVNEVQSGSPAETSGILAKDEILTVNSKDIKSSEEFIKIVDESSGKQISLLILRGSEEIEISLTPRTEVPEGEGPIGVVITSIQIKKYSWLEAPFYGTLEALNFSRLIVTGLGGLVADLVTTGKAPEGVAGPVGVAQLTGVVVQNGPVATLWFVSLLSLNLAVLNILPIPALDGGRFFFQIIELVTRKKVSPRYEGYAHAAGLVILLSLMVLITVFDVGRLISGQSLIPDM
jgi:regulator of sigma E protease